jgi:hypothetical protein
MAMKRQTERYAQWTDRCRQCVAAGLLAILVQHVSADAATVSEQLHSVQTLVEHSSAAKKVEASGIPGAIGKRDEARSLYERARSAFDAGDAEQAERLLRQATQTMYQAVRMTGMDQSLVDKGYRDFDARLESVNALCDAYERVRQEKGLAPARESELYPVVQQKLAESQRLKEQGHVAQARTVLDEAYVAAKVAIEHLRGGDTLVRSLNFANKEEEYFYEVDRNDTHRMLVTVLLKDKIRGDSRIEERVQQFLDEADTLRSRAEQQAAAGEYPAAVSTLEQSTREIVRAIRSAGVYIPG